MGATLKPLRRDKPYPSRLVVFDCEGISSAHKPDTQTLRFGIAHFLCMDNSSSWNTLRECVFRTPKEFVSFLDECSNTKETLYLCAHNMAYDGQILALPTVLEHNGWTTRRYVFSNSVWIHILSRGKHRLIVFDSLQLLRSSVAQLGKQVGLSKLPMPDWNASDDVWIPYCRRDVEIVALALTQYIEKLRRNKGGGFALTTASQALLSYRRHYMPKEIPLSRDERVMTLEQQAYHGGRVECFRLGEYKQSNYYSLDVNSMYPYVMTEYASPTACVLYSENVSLDRLCALMDKYHVIADVTVDISTPCAPTLHEGKLIFPVGAFRTQLHSPELQLALQHGRISAVHSAAAYMREHLFREYVSDYYALKRDATLSGDSSARSLAKLMLNSLYGKFGQYRIHRETIEHPEDDDHPAPLWSRYIGIASNGRETPITVTPEGLVVETRAGPTTHTHWGIAGAITSYARHTLWRYMSRVGLDDVFYVDTDSLITTEEAASRLHDYIDEDKLGYLKLDKSATSIILRGPKDYTFGATTKLKGVPQNAKMIAPGQYQYLNFRGVVSWMRSGSEPEVVVRPMIKTLKRNYDKGVLLSDGRVAPLCLQQSGAQCAQL